MNIFSKYVAVILSVVLMFFVPLNSMAQKQDEIVQAYVTQETVRFTDAIKNNGYLTGDMYLSFSQSLSKTDNIYEISITYQHRVINPVYSEDGVFQDKISVNYENVYSDDIRKALFEGTGTYYFQQGDYISVSVKNREKTLSARLKELLYRIDMPDAQIYAVYGGEIRDENY